MRLYTRLPEGVTIFMRAERGSDLVTQLVLFEYRKARAAVAYLYTPVPNSVRCAYRRIQLEADKELQRRIRKEEERLNAILNDPKSSEEDKLLARMELVGLQDQPGDEEEEAAS